MLPLLEISDGHVAGANGNIVMDSNSIVTSTTLDQATTIFTHEACRVFIQIIFESNAALTS